MDSTTRKAALRAAAKLTWGGGWSLALACSTGPANPHQEGPAAAPTVPGASPAQGGGGSGDVPRTPPGSSGGVTVAVAGGAGAENPATAGGAADGGASPAVGGAGGQPDAGAAGAAGARTAECTPTVPFDPNEPMVATVPEEDLACCVADVLEQMTDPAAKTDPSVVNCCTAIVVGSDSRSPHYGSDVRRFCCSEGVVAEPVALYNLPYCTPWGPPVPPEMPGALA